MLIDKTKQNNNNNNNTVDSFFVSTTFHGFMKDNYFVGTFIHGSAWSKKESYLHHPKIPVHSDIFRKSKTCPCSI